MNGKSKHFTDFRRAHRQSMLTQVEKLPLTKSNGSGRGPISPLQESLLPKTLWGRIWSHLVVTRADGKYTISQPLALVMIGVLGTAFFAYYWRSSDVQQIQREEIIVLRTQLKAEQDKNIDQDSKIDQARNYATIADKNQARLEGKFDQFALQYGIKNAAKGNDQ